MLIYLLREIPGNSWGGLNIRRVPERRYFRESVVAIATNPCRGRGRLTRESRTWTTCRSKRT